MFHDKGYKNNYNDENGNHYILYMEG